MNRNFLKAGVWVLLGLLALGCASVSPEQQALRDRPLMLVQDGLTALRGGDYRTGRRN